MQAHTNTTIGKGKHVIEEPFLDLPIVSRKKELKLDGGNVISNKHKEGVNPFGSKEVERVMRQDENFVTRQVMLSKLRKCVQQIISRSHSYGTAKEEERIEQFGNLIYRVIQGIDKFGIEFECSPTWLFNHKKVKWSDKKFEEYSDVMSECEKLISILSHKNLPFVENIVNFFNAFYDDVVDGSSAFAKVKIGGTK